MCWVYCTAVDSTLDSTVLAGAGVQGKHSTYAFHACVFLLVIYLCI